MITYDIKYNLIGKWLKEEGIDSYPKDFEIVSITTMGRTITRTFQTIGEKIILEVFSDENDNTITGHQFKILEEKK